LSRDLAALGARERAPLFMTLLAGWKALLGRSTGQEDLLVGVPTAGRGWVELEGLIGFFVNMLVLRTDLGGDPSFAALLARVRESALGAYAHADLPLERLVLELQPERSLSRTPLFQVAFALQTAPAAGPPTSLPGDLRLEELPLSSGVAKFDLTLVLTESGEGLVGELEDRRDLFDPTTARRVVAHLRTRLAGAARPPDRRLSQLPLLSAGEEAQARVEWNDTARPEPARALLVHERFAELARRQPGAVAVTAGPARLTYGELA